MSEVDTPATTVAGCRLGGVRFAVPMNDVAQLVSWPSGMIALPRREGALRGAFVLRDAVVPVVDLRRWLPWPGDVTADPAHVLVLRQGTRRLAVGIDAVDGLHRVDAGGARRLDRGDPGDEVFGSAVRLARPALDADAAQIALGLLDVAALMRLARVWSDAMDGEAPPEPEAPAQTGNAGAGSAASTLCAWLQSDGHWLAIPTAHLCSVVPMPTLQPLWQGDPTRMGVARWRGRDVPVLRLLPSLGVGEACASPWLAVVEHQGQCMGIPAQAVRDVQPLDIKTLQPIESLGIASHPILAGLWARPDGSQALLIDVPAWLSSDPLAILSTRAAPSSAAPQNDTPAHVVVQAGTPWALPISSLLEIVELPEAWAASPDPTAPWCHTWRQRSVPLWDLRALEGHGPTPGNEAAKVLILDAGAQPIGLVVESLLHLLPARSAERHEVRRPDGRLLPFVVHRDGDVQRSFTVLRPEDWPEVRVH